MAKNYSGLTRKQVTVGAYEVVTVDLYESGPNYFRVLNHGETRVYCGVTKIPSKNDYDFACDGGNVKMFAEPYKRSYLYIYNPSGTDIKVDVLSFYADFDPLTLAFSELKLDLSGYSFETTTAIDAFNAALPTGSNKIGKVDISNWPTDYAKAANQKDYSAAIASIKTAVDSLIDSVQKYLHTKSGTAATTAVEYAANGGAYICEIAFFSNDGKADITLTFTEGDNTVNSVVIKAGEVLNNIPCCVAKVGVSGSGDYRLVYCERNW